METVLLLAGLLDMAIAADGCTGKRNILGEFSFYGGLSMKSRISEGRWEDQIPYRENPGNNDQNDGRKSFDLLRNFSDRCYFPKGPHAVAALRMVCGWERDKKNSLAISGNSA